MTETIKAAEYLDFGLSQLNNNLAEYLESEIIFIKSPIYDGLDDFVRIEIEQIVRNHKKQKKKVKKKATANNRTLLPKLTVVFETTGGFIEVVERISNVFRRHFKEVDFIVPGHAFSAGTVLVLSGDRIFMDYYSVLGPIDPQIQRENGNFVPGMGYLYKYNDLIEKSREDEITDAELLFLTKRFDPAVMFVIEQAKNHSEELIKEWLPKYKFKSWKKTTTRGLKVTPAMKKERANKIAEVLGDVSKWHSHGRGITIRELTGNEIKLEIDDFGAIDELNHDVRQYYDLVIDYCRKIGAENVIHTKYGLTRVS